MNPHIDKQSGIQDSVVHRKTTRRKLIKTGVAVTGGLALGTTYVKPNLLSINLVETAYASGDPSLQAPVVGTKVASPIPQGKVTGAPVTGATPVSGTSPSTNDGPKPKPSSTQTKPSAAPTGQSTDANKRTQPVRPGSSDTP